MCCSSGNVLKGVAGVVCLVSLLGAAACAQSYEDENSESSMPTKTIEAVLKEHTNRLMSLRGVVGTAQGNCAGEPCIKVFVVKRTAKLVEQIPSTIEGYAVQVEETGEIRARDP